LAAAFELEKARSAGEAVEYTLFEAGSRLGGALASEMVDGTVLEKGPDSFYRRSRRQRSFAASWGWGRT